MISGPSSKNTAHNLPVLSVSEISGVLKQTVEQAFPRVRVRGELSGFKRAASGHLYFSLKDKDAVLNGVCWRGTAGRLELAPEDGMEVVATGRLTTYSGRSRYQIVVEAMELAGEGALLKLLEERRRRLTEEGLFDVDAKKELPFLPHVIGVVTSPTGAVIRDILQRIADRFPRRVLLWPVLVQGEGAAEQIAAAINGFNALNPLSQPPRPDLLIVARGGGSLEDLWAFNEEIVVRAAAASETPLISAIGHETDTTLIDFAADRRAPTPTAAAEMAVPVRTVLLAQVMDNGTRMMNAIHRTMDDKRMQLEVLVRNLPDLVRMVEESGQRLDDWIERLGYGLRVGMNQRRSDLMALTAAIRKPQHLITHARSRLTVETRAMAQTVAAGFRERRAELMRVSALLESCSYQRVLERGFVLVTGGEDRTISSVTELTPGDRIALRFHDGRSQATVERVDAGSPSGGVAGNPSNRATKDRGRKTRSRQNNRQGTLL
ncbi:MAG: exodeoxyribonuclease VII large subunit [Pseudomonadota bacterium]|nr:exodeoxyribonuclease VII large subunit [Pseudomonadota bacterium]